MNSEPSINSDEAIFLRFARNVEASSAACIAVQSYREVTSHVLARAGQVVLSPMLSERFPLLRSALEDVSIAVGIPSDVDDLVAGFDAELGITFGQLGVAETGSVLVLEATLRDRLVSMLCRNLVIIVERSSLVSDLDRAADWLSSIQGGEAGFASLITGPSRSADIERSLTIGVQGPSTVDVLVLS